MRNHPTWPLCAVTAAAVVILSTFATVGAVTPAEKCEQGKNNEAGKYAFCRQKAFAKDALLPSPAALATTLQKCADKYAAKWPLLEMKAAGACPSNGDETAIQGVLDDATTNVATALGGGPLVDCPADLATCGADLSTCGSDLTACSADLGTCDSALATSQGGLTACQGDLMACQAAPQGQLQKTAQTLCYDDTSIVSCATTTGEDGNLQKGLARSYTDNGDGTITDDVTGLMWEAQTDDDSIHDRNNLYTWSAAFAKMAALNAGGGFAGYTDWRLPNIIELQSLLNFANFSPAVSSPFRNCSSGCTSCSCTGLGNYWSSTTVPGFPQNAFVVGFLNAGMSGPGKTNVYFARAVRNAS